MSGGNLKRITLEEALKIKGKTDWERLRTMGDFEGNDEDDFEVDWTRAELVTPEPKKMISLRVDPDVLDFFKAQGRGYQTRINAVLRAYKEAQEKAG